MSLAHREYDSDEARAIFELAAELAGKEIRPAAAAAEQAGAFPDRPFALLGEAGLMGLPYPEELGGGGQPYTVYLQVVEELAGAWLAVGLGLSVHTLSCFPLATAGTREQQERWLPALLGGGQLGAYCLSEPSSGSDAGALATRAVRDGGEYVVDGVKAWISHAGHADFYTLFARTSGNPEGRDRAQGISCLHVPAGTPGVSAAEPERKMGMRSSATAQMIFESARVPAGHLVGVRRAGGSAWPWPPWTPGGWASRPAPPGWPRPRWTWPRATPGSAASSAGRSLTSRASRSSWPTWPPRWPRPGRCTWPRPGGGTPACRLARRRRWPSCSPATRP